MLLLGLKRRSPVWVQSHSTRGTTQNTTKTFSLIRNETEHDKIMFVDLKPEVKKINTFVHYN